MRTQVQVFVVTVLLLKVGAASSLAAQQPQIPTLQVCNLVGAKGRGTVQIPSRMDPTASGTFDILITLKCQSEADGYPAGTLEIRGLSMTDSQINGAIHSTAFEQVTATGKHTPTLYLNGRCTAEGVRGCRYWLLVADNRKEGDTKGTPDVVSLLVFNGVGKRVAYGTGPLVRGDITVAPTSN
jgi:hypothetical protein